MRIIRVHWNIISDLLWIGFTFLCGPGLYINLLLARFGLVIKGDTHWFDGLST